MNLSGIAARVQVLSPDYVTFYGRADCQHDDIISPEGLKDCSQRLQLTSKYT